MTTSLLQVLANPLLHATLSEDRDPSALHGRRDDARVPKKEQTLMENVVELKRRPRSRRDLIADATDRGQPLPLGVMLDNLHFWVEETKRLEASTDPSDRPLARIARHNAQRVAVDCAQFCHPKLTTQVIAGDEDAPVTIQHQHTLRPTADDLKGRSVDELSKIWLALSSGDEQRMASLVPLIAEQADG